MQAIKKTDPKKKKVLFVSIAIVSVLLTGAAFAKYQKIGPFRTTEQPAETINLDEPSQEQIEAGKEIKKNALEAKPDSTKPSGPNSSAGDSSPKTVGVEFSSGPSINNGTFSVRALIQEVNTSGSCTLILSRAGQPNVVKTAKTQPLASASTCQGFDFDVSGLQKGTWNVELSYKSSSASGKITESITL